MRTKAQYEHWWPEGPMPVSYLWHGYCCVCGEYLDTYQTKLVEKEGDRCACLKHISMFRGENPEIPGFRMYSDG